MKIFIIVWVIDMIMLSIAYLIDSENYFTLFIGMSFGFVLLDIIFKMLGV